LYRSGARIAPSGQVEAGRPLSDAAALSMGRLGAGFELAAWNGDSVQSRHGADWRLAHFQGRSPCLPSASSSQTHSAGAMKFPG